MQSQQKSTTPLLEHLREFSKKILEHSNTLFGIANAIYALALIHWGFPVEGTVACLMLFTLALKSYSLLPINVESFLRQVRLLSFVPFFLTPPITLEEKLIGLMNIDKIVDYPLAFPSLRRFVPQALIHPMPGKHEIPAQDMPSILKDMQRGWLIPWKINPTYVYADEVGQLLSLELEETLSKKTAKELWQAFDQKIQQQNLQLSKKEKDGLEQIRKGVVDKKTSNLLPEEIAEFQKIMKAFLELILQDEVYFEVKVRALAELGNSCTEGWLRDATFLLDPKSKDWKWAVHHQLSKLRGEKIKEILNKIELDFHGGSNDVHVTNAVQLAVLHRFRTFEGILADRQSSPSLFKSFVVNKLIPAAGQPITSIERIYFGCILGSKQIVSFNHEMLELITNGQERDPQKLIDCIYEAIKPHYEGIVQDGVYKTTITTRKISWEGITKWQQDFCRRYKAHFEDGCLTEPFIDFDVHGKGFLTKEGVALLLYDMGILTSW